jgi:predicted  nucleic acid-binding Zn-ribbon protein
MKYIKQYKLFLEQDETGPTSDDVSATPTDDKLVAQNDKSNQQALDSIQKDLATFQSKKQAMMDAFKDITKDDNTLNADLQKNVYDNQKDVKKRNKYLQSLEGIYKMKRRVDKITQSITDDTAKKADVQKQINDLTDRFNDLSDDKQKVTISTQIEKSRNYLKQLSDTIMSNNKELSSSRKDYDTQRKDFETQMKTEAEKIKNIETQTKK